LLKEISKLKINQPVLVKMSPDLPEKNVDEIIRISLKYKIKGFVCSNLTKEGIKGSGGYSGKIVSKKSDELLAHIYKKTKGKFVLIGAGGVFSAEDAYRKIKLGANLVQLMSGMIFEGPSLIGEINHGLAKLLKKDGFKNIAEAVGKGI
jgi:dihydroorotate dehydrogenase